MTTTKAYNFSDIYDGNAVPDNAFPASDPGLFEANSFDMTDPKYRMN